MESCSRASGRFNRVPAQGCTPVAGLWRQDTYSVCAGSSIELSSQLEIVSRAPPVQMALLHP